MSARSYTENSYTDLQSDTTSSVVDVQFADVSLLEACIEGDDDLVYEIIQDGVTSEEINKRDGSGRTGLSHACGNGFLSILVLLEGLDDVNANLPDNDGNTPLIFAAQAGHDDVVNFLLRHFRHVRVDDCNNLGFTALMKAAIQGRTSCAKLLLFAGANPNRRDHGRKLCAEQWARFCGRHSCADAIAKYIRSKKYFFTKTFILSRQKWNSEPELVSPVGSSTPDSGGWFQRHLSMKKKKKKVPPKDRRASAAVSLNLDPTSTSDMTSMRIGSAPMLVVSPVNNDDDQMVITTLTPYQCGEVDWTGSRLPQVSGFLVSLRANSDADAGRLPRGSGLHPPRITETDFDEEIESITSSPHLLGFLPNSE